MDNVLFLSAPLIEKLWGSNYFKDILKITDNNKIGEMWSCSALNENSSIILNGNFKGLTLNELYKKEPQLFNNENYEEFPILIKIIATEDDLSIQVHPDDKLAKRLENCSGKTEGWLILDAKDGASIINSHNAKDKRDLIKYVENDDYDHLLNKQIVKRGEFYPIKSGTIHAIGKNIVLAEVQQSSNITYRFYDYHRIDKNGKERELNVEKAIEATKYDPYIKDNKNCFEDNIETIWDNNYFKVNLYNVNEEYKIDATKHYLIVTVVDGNISVDNKKLTIGNSFICCYGARDVALKGNGKILVTTSK